MIVNKALYLVKPQMQIMVIMAKVFLKIVGKVVKIKF